MITYPAMYRVGAIEHQKSSLGASTIIRLICGHSDVYSQNYGLVMFSSRMIQYRDY